LGRYRDSYAKFVQGKPERLTFITDQLTLLARECAGRADADAGEVEKQLRLILADEVAVSERERRDVETQIGDETEGKDYKGRPDMPGVVEMDIKATEPVLMDELSEPDAKSDLNADTNKNQTGLSTSKVACERCTIRKRREGSILCAKCNQFVLGESEEDPAEPVTAAVKESNIPCPYCGAYMQAGATPQNPTIQNTQQYQCPNCGASIMANPGQVQQPGGPGFQQGMPTGVGGGMYASETKEADQGFEVEDEAKSPAEGDPIREQETLPPAVEQTGNDTADLYTSVIKEMANSQAAQAWSTAGDQDILDIAEAYNLDPDTVRANLKIVADFGDSVAVNGDASGDPSTEGLVELDQFGGRIPTTEEEVDVDSAISTTADRTSIESGDVYTLVGDAYGADLGGQQYVSVGGDARFYLPAEFVQQPGQDTDLPDESMEEAVESSTTNPPRFRSLQDFLEWDRNRVSA
jgi:DNA-directed RNA polymerase subunit RPC12/RpoP